MASGGGNSSVINGQLRHWSPSQIKTWRMCHRRWGYDKIFRPDLREGETGAQNFGTKVHSELEKWADTGDVPESEVAKAALSKLPARDASTFEAEVSISNPPVVAAGVAARGFVDLVVTAPAVAVWDYKTRGSFDWTFSPAELAEDTQMVTYGVWADERFNPQRDPAFLVELNHLYLLRPKAPSKRPPPKTPRKRRKDSGGVVEVVRRVSVLVSSAQLRDSFALIEQDVDEMKFDAAATAPEDLEPNYTKCWEFNRPCPYLMVCDGAPLDRKQGEAASQEYAAKLARENSMSEYESRTTPPNNGATEYTSSTGGAVGINPPDAAPNVLKLYVDCAPPQVDGVPNWTLLSEEIERRRLVVGDAGLLAHFRQYPPTGIVLVSSSPQTTAIVAVLASLATEVFVPE